LVIAPTPPSAPTTLSRRVLPRPDVRDQELLDLVEPDLLHDRLLDPQHRTP
jgi:hypothetical protein